ILPGSESVPPLPERSLLNPEDRPKSSSRTSTRSTQQDIDSLPLPPPPLPSQLKLNLIESSLQPPTPVTSFNTNLVLERNSEDPTMSNSDGDAPAVENNITSVMDAVDTIKLATEDGNVGQQLEMDQLNDPTSVNIVQTNPPNGTSLNLKQDKKLAESKEEQDPFIAGEDTNGDEDEISDFDELDLDDRDNKEEAWEKASYFARAILLFQNLIFKILNLLKRLTSGYLWTVVFLIGFAVYFVFAMLHKFGDEGSYRLLVCTILGIWIVVWPYLKKFVITTVRKAYGSDSLTMAHSIIFNKIRLVIRWLLYVAMTAFMVYVLVDEGRKSPRNLQALPGIFAFLLFAILFSTRPSKINWHTIFWSVALQFLCAMFVLKFKYGRDTVMWVQERFTNFFDNTNEGGRLIFGPSWKDHMFIFGALPLIWFTNAVFTMLYNLGAMQYIIAVIGKILQFVVGVSPLEAMSISAGIFMEGFTNLVVMRPFLNQLTKSQLFAVLTGCLSSLGGSYLAMLAALGISLEYVIPAMVVSAPATFAICKLMVPEARPDAPSITEETDELCKEEKGKYSNLMEAFQAGGVSVLAATGNVAVLGYIFMSMVSLVNHTFQWFGDRVGIEGFSIELFSSYALYPLALGMGVDLEDCRRVSMLLGYRIGIFNVVAFLKVGLC
ncbi:sodium/nucleoside cotransporter, partial [Elysia marginata]